MSPKLPLRQAVTVLVPLTLLTAGLAAIDLFDGTIGMGNIGRVEAGLVVFAVAAVVGWVLVGWALPRSETRQPH